MSSSKNSSKSLKSTKYDIFNLKNVKFTYIQVVNLLRPEGGNRQGPPKYTELEIYSTKASSSLLGARKNNLWCKLTTNPLSLQEQDDFSKQEVSYLTGFQLLSGEIRLARGPATQSNPPPDGLRKPAYISLNYIGGKQWEVGALDSQGNSSYAIATANLKRKRH